MEATVVATILVLNPELAFLGFLLDPVMLDVAILLLGTQLLLFNGQIRVFLAATYSRHAPPVDSSAKALTELPIDWARVAT
jgi:hypothetical protein